MKIIRKLILLILILPFVFPISVDALEKEINLHLFYREDCPHCAAEKEFLNKYLKDKPNVKLYKYEVISSSENRKLFYEVQELLDKSAKGVPYLVIGNKVIIGYNETIIKNDIIETIDYYLENNYRDLVGEKQGIVEVQNDIELNNAEIEKDSIDLPILGKVNPKNVSLPLIALVIGLVDGFNPCAMWILLFLITMLFGMKNRKKMWILGLTFLVTSAITYLLFMVSWLNLAMFMNQVTFIRIIISLFALGFGYINIHKYIKGRNEEAACEVVNDKKRKKIIKKIKDITTQKKFILSLLGIIVLAISVNIIELLCSLGLPVIFTQILSMNHLSTFEYALYMLIYILFFLIDDIIIFVIAMKTLKITGVSNKYTKYSHLIGGLIMVLIGLLMIFKPEWLMFNF